MINVGDAAHIAAASPGGPRYDATMTEEQRRHQSNGLWLCKVHAKAVDSDDGHFTTELLRKWKRDAEQRSFDSLVGLGEPIEQPAFTEELDASVQNAIECLGLAAGETVEAVTSRLLDASSADLAAFKRMPGWPEHPVALNLRAAENGRSFHAVGLAAAIQAFGEFTIVAPPGMGKTTTLMQVVDAINTEAQSVALFVPLGEWSSDPESFFRTILRRAAFSGIREEQLMLLAHRGRLVLALDGWNELDGSSRRRATIEVRRLQRDCPELGLLVSTRRQAVDVPLGGDTLVIDILSDEQQMEMARALRGQVGEALLDQAWRTPGVRELVSIPLYLTAFLSHTPGTAIPKTKEEVLRLFVAQHESKPEQQQALHDVLFGVHPRILSALAAEATHAANTAIPEGRARTVVAEVGAALAAAGQLTAAPQPSTVLDTLVDHHTLIRSGGSVISFQHQQFQEWYGSAEVEAVMRAAAAGDEAARRRLRVEFLDKRPWEESILFACERVSREGDAEADTVSHAVLCALSIDPILAAEMIYRSSEEVWDRVSNQVVDFIECWHKRGTVDRATRFMVASGRPEFADCVWPLIENPDMQVHLSALRVARRFRPQVLGANRAARLAAIPEPTRGHVLAELAMRGGIDGMALATAVAKADPSPSVQFEVIQGLQFRRADRHVSELLAVAAPEVWSRLAEKGYSEDIADPQAQERLRSVRTELLEAASNPLRRIDLLLETHETSSSDEDEIARAIADAGFPVQDEHAAPTLYRAFKRYPQAVAKGLVRRLAAGFELPFQSEDMLGEVAPIDDGPIAAAALAAAPHDTRGHAAARLAGPKTAGQMLDALIAVADRIEATQDTPDEATRLEYARLKDRIAATPAASFIAALIPRANTDETYLIGLLASLVSRHGSDDERKQPFVMDTPLARELIDCVRRWTATLLSSQEGRRNQMANLGVAIGRIGDPVLLPELKQLLDEDLARWRVARDQHRTAAGWTTSAVSSEAAHSWTLQYRDAFAWIPGESHAPLMAEYLRDPDFGFDAAIVVKAMSDRIAKTPAPSVYSRWADLSTVADRRAARLQPNQPAASPLADMIFSAIEALIAPGSTDEQQRLAIMLSRIAFAMPHEDKSDLIGRLYALPQPIRSKREMFQAFALDGEVLPADLLLSGVRAWIDETRENTWMLREGIWEIESWLELLPFTDRPETTLEAVDLVYGALPERARLERVVSSVSYMPGAGSEGLLESLYRSHPQLTDGRGWATAFLTRRSAAAAMMLVELVSADRPPTRQAFPDTWWLGERLAQLAQDDPALRALLMQRYQTIGTPAGTALIERSLAKIGDADSVLALVRGYARSGRGFDGNIHEALRAAAHDERPAQGWAGAISMHPVELTALRRELFRMTDGQGSGSSLAADTLRNIDLLRDYFGVAEFEPRHPDIESGRPWPPCWRIAAAAAPQINQPV